MNSFWKEIRDKLTIDAPWVKQVRIRAMENGVRVRCSWEKRQGGGDA